MYVLVRDEQHWHFWSADGHRFDASDQFIPLQKVFTAFSPDNVRVRTRRGRGRGRQRLLAVPLPVLHLHSTSTCTPDALRLRVRYTLCRCTPTCSSGSSPDRSPTTSRTRSTGCRSSAPAPVRPTCRACRCALHLARLLPALFIVHCSMLNVLAAGRDRVRAVRQGVRVGIARPHRAHADGEVRARVAHRLRHCWHHALEPRMRAGPAQPARAVRMRVRTSFSTRSVVWKVYSKISKFKII